MPVSRNPSRYDVTALGELVIDLVPLPSAGNLAFAAKPGGAPANLAAGVARLGLRAAMIGKVGDELFGRAALAALQATGVATEGILRDGAHNTPVAVVSQTPEGDADYVFFRENSADANLAVADLALETIAASRILHVGTLLLATPVSAAAQRRAVAHAKAEGVAVSTDVNFRAAFWRDPAAMRDAGLEMVAAASLVKLSREELSLLAGDADMENAVRALWHPGLLVVAITEGPAGATLFTAGHAASVTAFPVEAVDTVGCGDAFWASLLASLVEADMTPPRGPALHTAARRAAAAGAILATCSGALESMPTRAALDGFLRDRQGD